MHAVAVWLTVWVQKRLTPSDPADAPSPHRVRRGRFAACFVAIASVFVGANLSTAAAADVVVAAVGDTACDPHSAYFNNGFGMIANCRARDVGIAIAADPDVDAFLPIGDLQEDCGGYNAFLQAYDVEFGNLLGKTYPVPGNHEYRDAADYPLGTDCSAALPLPQQPAADGYFRYFQEARTAGDLPPDLPADATNPVKGFYTYDIGSWNIIAINTNDMCASVKCRGSDAATAFKGSAQEQWLRTHLAENKNRCVMAYLHYPRWSSNLAAANTITPDPTDSDVSPLVAGIWADLYQGGAELMLSGHAHNYERFFPQNAAGGRDDAFGVRQFVVGTGGVNLELNQPSIRNSAARMDPRRFGFLRLTLRDGSFSWAFKGIDGTTADPGGADCHGAPPSLVVPAAGATVTTGTTFTVSARVPAPGASDHVDFYAGAAKIAAADKAGAECHTNILTDPVVFYTSPFCVYSATAVVTGTAGGPTAIRAVVNSTDPATATATTQVSTPVTLRNRFTGIASINVDSGTGAQVAWSAAGSLREASYSQSRTRIVYSGSAGLVVADARGTNPRLLPGTAGARQPEWASADTRILYLTPSGIFAIPVGGGQAKRLAAGRVANFDVSPSGGRVLYQLRGASGRSDIVVSGVNGSGRRNVTRTPLVDETQPTWRTSTQIAFVRRPSTYVVYGMALRGGVQSPITSRAMNCQQPAFSPSGNRLACVTRTSATRSIIRVMTARGTGARVLGIRSPLPLEPVWGSDVLLAYTTN